MKRLMRAVWTHVLPRTRLTFNVGKMVTRTLLKPESVPTPVRVNFSSRIPMTLDLGTFVANDLFCLDEEHVPLF